MGVWPGGFGPNSRRDPDVVVTGGLRAIGSWWVRLVPLSEPAIGASGNALTDIGVTELIRAWEFCCGLLIVMPIVSSAATRLCALLRMLKRRTWKAFYEHAAVRSRGGGLKAYR